MDEWKSPGGGGRGRGRSVPKKIQKASPKKSSVPEVPGLFMGGGATAFRIVLKYQSSNQKTFGKEDRTWIEQTGRKEVKFQMYVVLWCNRGLVYTCTWGMRGSNRKTFGKKDRTWIEQTGRKEVKFQMYVVLWCNRGLVCTCTWGDERVVALANKEADEVRKVS
jgi:hypothetical protein